MTIARYYEIVCDTCGCAAHYQGNRKMANEQFKEEGGIVKNDKHFCDEDCLEEYKFKR